MVATNKSNSNLNINGMDLEEHKQRTATDIHTSLQVGNIEDFKRYDEKAHQETSMYDESTLDLIETKSEFPPITIKDFQVTSQRYKEIRLRQSSNQIAESLKRLEEVKSGTRDALSEIARLKKRIKNTWEFIDTDIDFNLALYLTVLQKVILNEFWRNYEPEIIRRLYEILAQHEGNSDTATNIDILALSREFGIDLLPTDKEL